jgi:hypothetical protein
MCIPGEECQGIFLSDTAVSGHVPSRRSCVFQPQPWHLDAARCFLACGYTLHIGDIAVMVKV